MDEARYRESRLCRVLGNPVAYNLVLHLSHNGLQTPRIWLSRSAGASTRSAGPWES